MAEKVEDQVKVGVGVEVLWRAMSMDLCHVLLKAAPGLVEDAQIIEGDGGLGTILLINFGPDVEHISYQKEKIVELDETNLRIGLQVVEGGHLDYGFTSYTTSFQLTDVGDRETLVDFKVTYELEDEDSTLPERTLKSSLYFIKCLESYLQEVTL